MNIPKTEREAISFVKRQKVAGISVAHMSRIYEISYFTLSRLVNGHTKKFSTWRNIERYHNSTEND